jgi:hypothetical protein
MLLERLVLLETSTDSMYTTLTKKDLNGMKYAAKLLKITIQLQHVLGNQMVQRLLLAHSVDLLMSLMYA